MLLENSEIIFDNEKYAIAYHKTSNRIYLTSKKDGYTTSLTAEEAGQLAGGLLSAQLKYYASKLNKEASE